VPLAENEFVDRLDGMHFRFENTKDATMLHTSLDGQKIAGRMLRPVTPTKEMLGGLEGTYLSPELGTFGSIAARDGKLHLQLPKGEGVLQFLDDGDCLARPRDAFFSLLAVKFTRDDAGRVTGYTVSTERVRNLRYDRLRVEGIRH
jgi:hypothetical protein